MFCFQLPVTCCFINIKKGLTNVFAYSPNNSCDIFLIYLYILIFTVIYYVFVVGNLTGRLCNCWYVLVCLIVKYLEKLYHWMDFGEIFRKC